MIGSFSTPHNRVRTLIFLALCGLLAIGAAVVGIDDNLPGVLLAFLSATVCVIAFSHPWRTSRQFMRLFYASVAGFILFALLHNVLEGIAWNSGGSGLVYSLLGGLGAVFFLIAVLLCPAGVVVSVVGALVMSIRGRGHSTPGSTTAT